ncbi:hypothetical protein V6N13_146605 [Hibiscus sabdariffa]|uniref:Uncharacterized protein n=1 Tax=Hibiscus sabdariffa TaxID=183260 RepID=A0ABR2TTF1_9ROSI
MVSETLDLLLDYIPLVCCAHVWFLKYNPPAGNVVWALGKQMKIHLQKVSPVLIICFLCFGQWPSLKLLDPFLELLVLHRSSGAKKSCNYMHKYDPCFREAANHGNGSKASSDHSKRSSMKQYHEKCSNDKTTFPVYDISSRYRYPSVSSKNKYETKLCLKSKQVHKDSKVQHTCGSHVIREVNIMISFEIAKVIS